MAVKKAPKKVIVKKPAKAAPKKAVPVKKAASKSPAKKVPAKSVKPAVKVAVKSKTVKKAAPKKAEAPKKAAVKKSVPVKKTAIVSKSNIKQDTSKNKMLTKTNNKSGTKKFAEDKHKTVAAPAPKPVIKKEEPVRISRNIKLKNDPSAILRAIPKDEIKPFTRTDKQNFAVKEKLQAIYYLQQLDSRVDEIRIIRGELPMEVSDLQDEVEGLNTRISNYNDEVASLQETIMKKKQAIKESNTQIKKYEAQQMNVKNNREYDSLTKEIEFQQLEIQLSEKRIKEFTFELNQKNAELDIAIKSLEERSGALKQKQNELEVIIGETQKEEERMLEEAAKAEKLIDVPLLAAYKRIRGSMLNGLAVVKIHRDACGGCFNKIPPQMQLEIGQRKKVTICEHCGRILVDASINDW
ncbi:MAG: C4-type zinc ribbon domain-containing protein [Bacteroidia bacterium]